MKKIMILSFVLAVLLALLNNSALGIEFCVSDETGFQNALNTADGNGQDDIIKVEQGTYNGNFDCFNKLYIFFNIYFHSSTYLSTYESMYFFQYH